MNLRIVTLLVALASIFAVNPAAFAQEAETEESSVLARCIVGNSTGNDRVLVARWVGASLASAPQLEGLVTVNEQEREQIDRQMAALFQRLITVDCLEEARPLFAERDFAALGVAFRELGGAAIRELMSNPRADAAMQSFARFIDQEAFAVLEADAKR